MPDAKLNENAEPVVEPETLGHTPQAEPDSLAENLQRENAELKDRLLRALADMENLRRRTEKEVADAKLYGISSFASDMLSFADNSRRAVESIPQDLREGAEPAIKTLIEGIELTERDFLARLARHGVKKIDTLGTKFDPNLHEALFEVPDDSVPNGTVVKVVEDGYAIGNRVVRPAKVGVSRNTAKGRGE
ncbi:MAG TPA: nucleotide exchange factor GrpE [Methylovirgula sp.]|nr:nucleotide exchange factor GrpE [Methylovirgula sp.]